MDSQIVRSRCKNRASGDSCKIRARFFRPSRSGRCPTWAIGLSTKAFLPRAGFLCHSCKTRANEFQPNLREPLRNKSQAFDSSLVSHWNFSTFSPMGSVWVMPQQAAHGRAIMERYPPRFSKHGSYPGEFRAMRLYKHRRTRIKSEKSQCSWDESVLRIQTQVKRYKLRFQPIQSNSSQQKSNT